MAPATEAVIAGIIDRHVVEAQGYLDCQNILESLGKRNKARLEALGWEPCVRPTQSKRRQSSA
ncbi:hypothetical protein [Paenarthrobacter ureafaciens]|uniref:hypothetical protein n=1 Tax=Paenarthrobacter ureafaciens TaxID=37931 RepID=UPI001FB2FBD9|nr:hypothetical protein [Paenarthrobacter ureafaciens]UOD83524.1 hypothetical protein MQZ73_20800 [Paenarthrobacter ureafaciens]